MEVKKILIPNKPHLDPIAAIYLLGQYGQEKYPGINSAKIIFWENSHNPSAAEMEKFNFEGVLMIDIGGGLFDHHDSADRKETATCRVAKYLGIESRPELSALLAYVREDDLEGLHNRYGDLAYIIKCLHKQNVKPAEVVSLAFQYIHCLQEGQKEWHIGVKKEYETKAKILKVKRNQKKLKIAIIESDNAQVANYAITTDNFSVVIQKRSSGHVIILTNKYHRIDLREIVAAIRKKELELRSYNKPIEIDKLKFEGKNQLLPFWFYHRSLNSFLNGSEALNKTEATKLPFNNIIRFVIYGISTEESELCDCASGGQKCPYKDYGFRKCKEKKGIKF
jgi:hypothetical protein